MNPRTSKVDVTYHDIAKNKKKNISRSLAQYMTSFTYTDPADGESDTVSISIEDREHKWSQGWLPNKKDSLTVTIKTYNFKKDGENKKLVCGKFVIDSLSVSGNPRSVEVGGISGPVQNGFRDTSRGKTWKKTNIARIAKTICKRYGLTLHYDAAGIPIAKSEQSEADSSFLQTLCETYGLCMKAYKSKIVIFDRERYKKKKAVHTLTLDKDTTDWSWNDTLTRVYTGGRATYTKKKKKIHIKIGTSACVYRMTEAGDSAADTKRRLKAAVNKENHGKTTLEATITGDTSYLAGQCVTVKGAGSAINGKYFIDKAEHKLDSSGYETSLTMSKVYKSIG